MSPLDRLAALPSSVRAQLHVWQSQDAADQSFRGKVRQSLLWANDAKWAARMALLANGLEQHAEIARQEEARAQPEQPAAPVPTPGPRFPWIAKLLR